MVTISGGPLRLLVSVTKRCRRSGSSTDFPLTRSAPPAKIVRSIRTTASIRVSRRWARIGCAHSRAAVINAPSLRTVICTSSGGLPGFRVGTPARGATPFRRTRAVSFKPRHPYTATSSCSLRVPAAPTARRVTSPSSIPSKRRASSRFNRIERRAAGTISRARNAICTSSPTTAASWLRARVVRLRRRQRAVRRQSKEPVALPQGRRPAPAARGPSHLRRRAAHHRFRRQRAGLRKIPAARPSLRRLPLPEAAGHRAHQSADPQAPMATTRSSRAVSPRTRRTPATAAPVEYRRPAAARTTAERRYYSLQRRCSSNVDVRSDTALESGSPTAARDLPTPPSVVHF